MSRDELLLTIKKLSEKVYAPPRGVMPGSWISAIAAVKQDLRALYLKETHEGPVNPAPKRWRCKGCGYLLPAGPDVFLEIGWWKDESGHAQHWTGKHPNDPDGKWCGPVEEET